MRTRSSGKGRRSSANLCFPLSPQDTSMFTRFFSYRIQLVNGTAARVSLGFTASLNASTKHQRKITAAALRSATSEWKNGWKIGEGWNRGGFSISPLLQSGWLQFIAGSQRRNNLWSSWRKSKKSNKTELKESRTGMKRGGSRHWGDGWWREVGYCRCGVSEWVSERAQISCAPFSFKEPHCVTCNMTENNNEAAVTEK